MLSLPLAKLSVARDEDPSEQRFEWKHESQHLTFVLDSYGSYAGLQQLKVVQGTQVRVLVKAHRHMPELDADGDLVAGD